jgi:DNA-binding MarR family transcriptional regulator
MNDAHVLALLRLLAEDGEVSPARAAKQLGLGASELNRLLVALGNDPRFDGLDLVERIEAPHRDGTRERLRLTARGRALCADSSQGGAS